MPPHCGLYFTATSIDTARAHQDREPFQTAWALLRGRDTQAGAAANALWHALRVRFDNADPATALDYFRRARPAGNETRIDLIGWWLAQTQTFELLRDHADHDWLASFGAAVDQLTRRDHTVSFVDALWQNLLTMAAGVVLEDARACDQAADTFRQTIRESVHPEGYINAALGEPDGGTLQRMLRSAQALILTAEIGTHAGYNLWSYESRGVSALTPVPYLLYYYYYPEKWRWESDLELEATQAFYRQHAGFWEIANHRGQLRDLATLLDDLRPVFDAYGGGLTTLSHSPLPRRRGLFG